jgi:hypothetical protein
MVQAQSQPEAQQETGKQRPDAHDLHSFAATLNARRTIEVSSQHRAGEIRTQFIESEQGGCRNRSRQLGRDWPFLVF